MNALAERTVRIGCASAFWGDTAFGARQLVAHGEIDYLVFDYLAEITMSLLARARAKDPDAGFVPDFVQGVIKPLAKDIAAKKIKVIANAGGMNPVACKAAVEAVLVEAAVGLKVAAVIGDDLMPDIDRFRQAAPVEMFSGAAMPATFESANAYLGATPIRAALAEGADIVVTGRVVDSAVTLGALMYEFAWGDDDYDRLAAGSAAGHVIECGTQVTGGLFTDWRRVADGWDNMGFPIVECAGDGTFVVTKPPGTGGLVTPETVAEQVVYEVGDPAAYLLPDVTCDLSRITLEQAGEDRVAVSGVRGRAPSDSLKVCATWHDGYRVAGTLMIGGIDAAAKSQAVGEALIKRTRRSFREANLGDYEEVSLEVLGAEATYGPHSRAHASREVILKLAARHKEKAALELLAREIAPAATSMAPGITGLAGGRPRVQPVIRLFSFLVDKSLVPVSVLVGERAIAIDAASVRPGRHASTVDPSGDTSADATEVYADGIDVPLVALAHGRSGDKGDKVNIGILARRPEFVPVIRGAATAPVVKRHLAHVVKGAVERFEWPGLDGFNYLLHDALGGGGVASLRHDPQGKALAQMLLDLPVRVPAAWLRSGGLLHSWTQDEASEGAT